MTPVRRSDLFLARLDPTVGSEQAGVRPVLVVKGDLANSYFRTVLSAPVSASPKAQQREFTVRLSAGERGLPRDSAVLVFQIRTLDRARPFKRIGHLPAERMAEVERAILICFGMEHLLV
jgi:mRNA interferase MazF